jgi:hypothetical protein
MISKNKYPTLPPESDKNIAKLILVFMMFIKATYK